MNTKIRLQPLFVIDDNCDIYGYEALYTKGADVLSYPSAASILRTIAFNNADHNDLNFKYFINMTNDDAINPSFVNDFLKLLDKISIDHSRIVLELNEATDPAHLEQAKRNLSILRAHGINIALDDFGTCFSTLEFMSKLPLDIVKIDKQFIQNAPLSRKDMSLLKFSIEVSHDIGCLVVAEGIETQEQMNCVLEAGADVGQGFIFSAPSLISSEFSNNCANNCANGNPFISLIDFGQYLSMIVNRKVAAA